MANSSGQAYAFMSMTAVMPGREPDLEAMLAAWPKGPDSPLARMGTTHFARFLVLHDLVYQGEPQVRDSLESAYLIFVSNFDGELEAYLDSLLEFMPDEAEQVWGLCAGCPSLRERDDFLAYLLHNQVDTTFFLSAYPEATVQNVRDAVDLRRRLSRMAVDGQRSQPAELMRRWRAEFAEVTR